MDSNNSLVSVIMPVYNVDLYVREAIDSILNQTFPDFEFIIIDDGSTDNTWSIVQSYSDKRIITIRNKTNIGNYPSRNRGMSIAKGKYIAVMDGDDIAMPERLEKQVLYLEDNSELIALGTDFNIIPEEKKNDILLEYEDLCFLLLRGFGLLHPSLMIKADVLRNLNGYNENYKYASDYNLLCMLSLVGKIENLPYKLMKYRKHSRQISQSKKSEQDGLARLIRRKYQMNFVNKYKHKDQDIIGLEEVGVPEIGMVVCCYTYADKFNESKYKELADKTIDVICKIITRDMPVCIEDGLCGLGCGLHYLIRNNFLDGDVDEVLEDIDDKIIETLRKKDDKDKEYVADMLFYIHYRISKSENMNSKRMQYLNAVYSEFTTVNQHKQYEP